MKLTNHFNIKKFILISAATTLLVLPTACSKASNDQSQAPSSSIQVKESLSPSLSPSPQPMTQANASPGSGGAASNARSAPSSGGVAGTVDSVSSSSFTITTLAGVKVTVNEASSTTYKNGTSSTSTSAITNGENVLTLGTATVAGKSSDTIITATQVIVQPDGGGSATSSGEIVVPFQPGKPATAKQVGQIPENYTEGSGTIVSGTAADQATEAGLAVYPGGVVDRVVLLSTGEYEVHNIGVSWPHHFFVSKDFKVLGAN
jgi:hypothetical protein